MRNKGSSPFGKAVRRVLATIGVLFGARLVADGVFGEEGIITNPAFLQERAEHIGYVDAMESGSFLAPTFALAYVTEPLFVLCFGVFLIIGCWTTLLRREPDVEDQIHKQERRVLSQLIEKIPGLGDLTSETVFVADEAPLGIRRTIHGPNQRDYTVVDTKTGDEGKPHTNIAYAGTELLEAIERQRLPRPAHEA